jgi:MoxR-like ATPase
MNIQEAKTEICNTLRAYLAKDENGYYTYPLIRQRPLLLIGPPGIGKTAIMEQAAAVRCGTCSLHHYPSHPSECHRSSGDR